jgi:hypothetical protein
LQSPEDAVFGALSHPELQHMEAGDRTRSVTLGLAIFMSTAVPVAGAQNPERIEACGTDWRFAGDHQSPWRRYGPSTAHEINANA